MRRFRIAAFLSLLAAAALLAAGCGSGGGSSSDARSTIDKGFSTSIGSANVTIGLQLQAQGVPTLKQPLSLKIAGPYQSNGKNKLPSLNFQISGSGGGQSFTAGFVSTGDDAFVGFQGQNYEVGKAQVAQLNSQLGKNSGQKRSLKDFGIDPQNWVTNPQSKGSENVNGTDTNHVQAGVDVGKMLTDLSTGLQKASSLSGTSTATPRISPTSIAQIKKYVKNPKFDLWVGKSDNKIRRLKVAVDFSVPASSQSKVSGLKSGTIDLSVDFANVGQKQTITAPANAKPLSQLSGQLGGLGGALGGGTSGGTGGTGGTGASQQKLQAYSACVSKANPSDTAAIQRCAQLLK